MTYTLDFVQRTARRTIIKIQSTFKLKITVCITAYIIAFYFFPLILLYTYFEVSWDVENWVNVAQ